MAHCYIPTCEHQDGACELRAIAAEQLADRKDADRKHGGWGRGAAAIDICPGCLREGTLVYIPGFGAAASNECPCGYREGLFI